jgi:TolB protein
MVKTGGVIEVVLFLSLWFPGCKDTQEPVKRSDGAELLYAPELPASAQNPAFAPDGKTILFTLFHKGYNQGPAGLYLQSLANSSPLPLLDETGFDNVNVPGSSWNGATNQITFVSDRENTDEIWTVEPDGSSLYRVTNHIYTAYFIEPTFSPDGQWIVLEVDQDTIEGLEQGSIWMVRVDGSDLTQLTNGPAGGTDDRLPNWSPAGDRILFQRSRQSSEDWNIYTIATDGGNLKQVTTDSFADTDASWSPDGQWIVYSTDYGNLPHPNIFAISVDGGTPVRITTDSTREDGAPSWSPDGKWIAFESHTTTDENSPSVLWRIAVPAAINSVVFSKYLNIRHNRIPSVFIGTLPASDQNFQLSFVKKCRKHHIR